MLGVLQRIVSPSCGNRVNQFAVVFEQPESVRFMSGDRLNFCIIGKMRASVLLYGVRKRIMTEIMKK